MLQQKAPWWESRTVAALMRLAEPPPVEHASHTTEPMSWGSNDPVVYSLQYLDEVLAARAGSLLDAYRRQLVTIIAEAWDTWTGYTRGLALLILRTYYWAECDELRGLPAQVLRSTTQSGHIQVALGLLLRLGGDDATEVMRTLVARIGTLTSPSETAYLIGQIVGNAVVRHRADREYLKELAETARWYDEIMNECSQGQPARLASRRNLRGRRISSCGLEAP